MFKKFKHSGALPDEEKIRQRCEKYCINAKGYNFVEWSRKVSSKNQQGTNKILLKGYKEIISLK